MSDYGPSISQSAPWSKLRLTKGPRQQEQGDLQRVHSASGRKAGPSEWRPQMSRRLLLASIATLSASRVVAQSPAPAAAIVTALDYETAQAPAPPLTDPPHAKGRSGRRPRHCGQGLHGCHLSEPSPNLPSFSRPRPIVRPPVSRARSSPNAPTRSPKVRDQKDRQRSGGPPKRHRSLLS
jgi:hypothetical protein